MNRRRWWIGFGIGVCIALVSAGWGIVTLLARLHRADPGGQTSLREFVELRLAIGDWPVNDVAPGAFPSARMAAPAIVRLDLDGDGQAEALVTFASAENCDGFGCPIEVWRWRPEGVLRILRTYDLPLTVDDEKIDGWRVLHGRRHDYVWMRKEAYPGAPCEPTALGKYVAWCRADDDCLNFYYKLESECVQHAS